MILSPSFIIFAWIVSEILYYLFSFWLVKHGQRKKFFLLKDVCANPVVQIDPVVLEKIEDFPKHILFFLTLPLARFKTKK